MRWMLILVTAGACGNDRESVLGPDAGVVIAPDGRIISPDGRVPDGGDAGMDGPDAAVPLTECEEAALRSDLAWIQDNIFTPSCAIGGCHVGPNADVGLRLEVGQSHANLVNRGSSTASGWTRVVPGSLAASYLMVTLRRADGPAPGEGFMPLRADALCVEKLGAIERWILAGAPP